MRIFLYEWATGGGLVEESTSLPPSLLREGAAMARALAADLMRIPDCRVTALRDVRAIELCLPGCDILDVDSRFHHDQRIRQMAAEADATILIAPEFDRILERVAIEVQLSDGRLVSPEADFIRLAADKQRTAARLARAGLPTPPAVVVEPDESLPADFRYPAVLKPLDGAGSQDTQVVAGPHDTPAPYAWPRRLEQFCPGLAASVAVLCGAPQLVTLPPCRQSLSDDGRLRYLGGRTELLPGLAERASQLARAAVAAMPSTRGYVGVDLILGSNPHGDEDFVIEINPRLTTSYVGLRTVVDGNLADVMLRTARGESTVLAFHRRAVEFDVDGNVSFIG